MSPALLDLIQLLDRAPWWAVVLVVLVVLGGAFGLEFVRAVFPQDSADRLRWWQDRGARRDRRLPPPGQSDD